MRFDKGQWPVVGFLDAPAGIIADWHEHPEKPFPPPGSPLRGDHLMICTKGRLKLELSPDEGATVSRTFVLDPAAGLPCANVPSALWHRATALVDGTTMMCVFGPGRETPDA